MKYAQIGAVCVIIGVTCLGGLTASGNVLTLAALKLGATEMFLGLLSFAMLGTRAFGIFTMSAVEKHGKRRVLIFWKAISALCVIPFIFLPLLVNRWSSGACLVLLLTATFFRTATYSLGNTGWFPLLQDIVPQRITGRFFANIRTSWQTAGLVTLLVIAWFLGKQPGWWKFEVIFIVAFVAYIVRVLTIIGMVENPVPSSPPERIGIFARFSELLREKQLRRLVFYIVTYWFAAIIAEPFKIKFLKDLGYSYGFILGATAMVSAGAIVSLRFWGKLADRFGNRFILSLSHIAMPIATIFWLFVGKGSFGSVLVLALFFFWSIFHSGNGIAQTRYILHAVPPDKQNQINVINVFATSAMGIAPLVGGLFLALTSSFGFEFFGRAVNNYHMLFIVAAALFILPHLLQRKLKSTKDAPTMQVVAFVTRPLRDMFGPFIRINRRNRN